MQAEPRRGVVAQPHHVVAPFDAEHLGHGAGAPPQVVVDGEGEIALAGAEVGHAHRRRALQRRGVEGVREDLDELVDLPPLARHRRDQPVRRVGDAEGDEERRGDVDVAVPGAVVRRRRQGQGDRGGAGAVWRRRRRRRRSGSGGEGRRVVAPGGGAAAAGVVRAGGAGRARGVPRRHAVAAGAGGGAARRRPRLPQRRRALPRHQQLRLLAAGGEQVRVAEVAGQGVAQPAGDLGQGDVPRHVARRVAQRRRQHRRAAQRDRPRDDALQARLGAAVLGEHEPVEAAARQVRGDEVEEARGRGRRRAHRRGVPSPHAAPPASSSHSARMARGTSSGISRAR